MLDFIDRIESSVRGYVRSFPTVFASASGSWLTDVDERQYLDFFSGAGALNYGHNNPRVKQALLDYISVDGIQHSLDMATKAKVGFLQDFERIILAPRRMDYRIQFTGPTGTNAVEAAIKLARKVKQRSHVVAFTNAYHGHSLGALALTGNRYFHDDHYGSHNNVTHFPYDGYLGRTDTTRVLEKMLTDGSSGLPLPAAVIVETVQGEGGINVASHAWLRNLSRICDYHDILLIVDDIQVGVGRTGTFFSFEAANIQPAMICLSKSIGGGLPMSLLMMRPEFDAWKPGEHTGTFRGNNLAFVAARALLSYWSDEDFQSQIAEKATVIEDHLLGLCKKYPQRRCSVRGRGMVWGIDVGNGSLAKRITTTAFEHGLVIESAGADDQVIKLLPALTIENKDLQTGLEILDLAFETCLREDSRPAEATVAVTTRRSFGPRLTLPSGSAATLITQNCSL